MKKKLTRRHKLAIAELAIALAIGVAFFCPRTFSGAMGGAFDPAEMVQAQVLLQGAGEKAGDDRTITLTPGQPAYETLVGMLEDKLYFPYYTDSTTRDVTLDYWVTILFTQPDGKGVRTYAFSGSRAIDTAGEDTRDRSFQLSDGLAFQQGVLDFLLEQEYTTGE